MRSARSILSSPILSAGLVACLALAVAGWLRPAATLGGLLCAFLFWIAIPAGSAVLLHIHALTGGEWGRALRPVLSRCAGTMPLFVVAFVPIALGARLLYPWAGDPGAAAWGDVGALYLNVPGFMLRGLAVLALWCAMAWSARSIAPNRLRSGLFLALYGITVTVAAVDWSMSLAPRWSSSSAGAAMAIGQLGAALGFALLVGADEGHGTGRADTARLTAACVLGYVYLGFMQFLVMWSGNLPTKAAWYLHRMHGPVWPMVIWAALLGGAVLPFCLLLARRSESTDRVAGLLVLTGMGLDRLWQTAAGLPQTRGWALGLAALALGAVWVGIFRRMGDPAVATRVVRHA